MKRSIAIGDFCKQMARKTSQRVKSDPIYGNTGSLFEEHSVSNGPSLRFTYAGEYRQHNVLEGKKQQASFGLRASSHDWVEG